MLKIGFHTDGLGERGVEVSVYDYAYYTKHLYKYIPIIFYKKNNMYNDPNVIKKFEKEFMCFSYTNFYEVEQIILKENIKYLYIQCEGRIGTCTLSKYCKNLVHSVFTVEPHGDVYATIFSREAIRRKYSNNIPYIPYIVDLPTGITTNMRDKLNIPSNAIVIGRYGGYDQFNISYVHDAIKSALAINPKLYFLFINTEPFYKHERIIYLDKIVDLNEKVRFINSCDAMIHARIHGETFGLAIAEFSLLNKPVITCVSNTYNMHVQILGDKGIYYEDFKSCLFVLNNIEQLLTLRTDWNAYREFTPEKVMKIFMEVFNIKPDNTLPPPPPLTPTTVELSNTAKQKSKRILFTQYYEGFTKEKSHIYLNFLNKENYVVDYIYDITQPILDTYDVIICGSFIHEEKYVKLLIQNKNKVIFNITEPIECMHILCKSTVYLCLKLYSSANFPLTIGCVPDNATHIKFPLYLDYDYFMNVSTINETNTYIKNISSNEILLKKFCCLINRHDYGNTRVPIYTDLSQLGVIDCPSKLLNNYSNKDFEKMGRVNFQRQYLFCICPENFVLKMDGYITEKLFMAIYSGCIPIYYGKLDNIDLNIFNINRILYFDPKNPETVRNVSIKVKELMQDKNKLVDFYKQPPFCDTAIDTYNTIINTANTRLNAFIENTHSI